VTAVPLAKACGRETTAMTAWFSDRRSLRILSNENRLLRILRKWVGLEACERVMELRSWMEI